MVAERSSEDAALMQLAEEAGLIVHWQHASGEPRTVTPEALCALLGALDLPAASAAQIAASRALLAHEKTREQLPPLLTAQIDTPLQLPMRATNHDAHKIPYQLTLEHGAVIDGMAEIDSTQHILLPAIDTIGYHTLCIGGQRTTLAVAPLRCPGIDAMRTGASSSEPTSTQRSTSHLWGIALQLYSLCGSDTGTSTSHLGGIGDFSSLRELVRLAAPLGAAAVAISPVHAGFVADPTRYSPYAPSSRLFLNALYANPDCVFSAEEIGTALRDSGSGSALQAADGKSIIDWTQVGPARIQVLRTLFASIETRLSTNGTDELSASFALFCRQQGQALLDHARFETIHALQLAQGQQDWRQWPSALQDPRSTAVAECADAHPHEVRFHLFLQWLADRSMGTAQQQCRDSRMPIGLIADLAVGADAAGSQCWSSPDELLAQLSCGAPPDIYNPRGQSWGLAPLSPRGLVQHGYRSFIDMLRAALRHAGGVRIDHILGLQRLWLVPSGASPADGAYLRYPFDDLVRLIKLEAARHHAIVIGENLGTVPEGFNDKLDEAGILGTSVLWFERSSIPRNAFDVLPDAGPAFRFHAPEHWPRSMVATTTTHDLPTITGWWTGHDIEWRARLGLLGADRAASDAAERREHESRSAEREALLDAIAQTPLQVEPEHDISHVTSNISTQIHAELHTLSSSSAPPLDEVIRFVGQSAAPLVLLPLEDAVGAIEQPNIPGTTDEHPNWRRRIRSGIEQIFNNAEVRTRLEGLNRARERADESLHN